MRPILEAGAHATFWEPGSGTTVLGHPISFADGSPLALGVAERDVTYRLETDDLVMFWDVRKV